jgi:hypothetical protein
LLPAHVRLAYDGLEIHTSVHREEGTTA